MCGVALSLSLSHAVSVASSLFSLLRSDPRFLSLGSLFVLVCENVHVRALHVCMCVFLCANDTRVSMCVFLCANDGILCRICVKWLFFVSLVLFIPCGFHTLPTTCFACPYVRVGGVVCRCDLCDSFGATGEFCV